MRKLPSASILEAVTEQLSAPRAAGRTTPLQIIYDGPPVRELGSVRAGP
jgi:hypothetical protein